VGKAIYNNSLKYNIIRIHVRFVHRLFYNSFIVEGKENIPKEGAVIFAPNHQNALMDAIAIVCAVPQQVVFMARADIFYNPLVAKILRFFKILPVYRIRDGYSNLSKNEEHFNEVLDVLGANNPFCIMPEGLQSEKHRLMPLVKGIFRIALAAQHKNPQSKVWIVPVGIDYSDWESYKSDKILRFGKPIDASSFYHESLKNCPAAINDFKNRLTNNIKHLMINIESGEHYITVDKIRHILHNRLMVKLAYKKDNSYNRYLAQKWFTDYCNRLHETNSELLFIVGKLLDQFESELTNLNLHKIVFTYKRPSLQNTVLQLFVLIFASPVFTTGYLINILPVRLPKIFISSIKDRQFHASYKYVLAVISFPLWYIVLYILVSFFIKNYLASVLIIIILAITGELAYKYFRLWEKFSMNLRLILYWQKTCEARNILDLIEKELKLDGIK
jgi:1-acyl-sn-glycerol-3-phosphate acyltransferase